MKEGVAFVVVGEALQVEIRGGQGLVELFDGFVKLAVAISGGAGIEMQARVIAFALEEVLVLFEGLVILAGFVFTQGGGGGGGQGGGKGHNKGGERPKAKGQRPKS